MIGLAKGGFGGFGALFSSKKYSDVFYPKYEAAIVMFFLTLSISVILRLICCNHAIAAIMFCSIKSNISRI